MNNYEKNAHLVEEAVEQKCAFLQPDPFLVQRVLNVANEKGEVKMKKKFSVGFVIVLALMLVSVTAFAASMVWQQYAKQLAQQEHEQGYYASWSADDRVDLVKSLMEMGYLQEAENTARMLAEDTPIEERQALADEILLKLIGEESVDEVSLSALTYAIMGYEDFWSPEQRVWWQGIIDMYRNPDANDTYVVPQADDLPEEKAIAVARAAILDAYELPADALDNAQPVANLYITKQHPDDRRWEVTFKQYQEGTDHYEVQRYTVIVNSVGEVIGDPDIPVDDIYTMAERRNAVLTGETELDLLPATAIYNKYSDSFEYPLPFESWPAEVKAAFSQEVQPTIADVKGTKDFRVWYSQDIVYCTYLVYGMPENGELSESAALDIARKAMMDQCGASDHDVAQYTEITSAYDVTDASQPLWKFTIWNPNDVRGIWYRVMVNGQTGDIAYIEAFPWQAMHLDDSQETFEHNIKYYY